MYNQSRGGKSGGFRGGSRGFGGGRDGERQTMHSAICNQCKAQCEVPFRPNGKKPIYCKDCFKRDGDSAPKRFDRGGERSFSQAPERGGNDNIGAQLREINEKLDALIEALSGGEEEGEE